MDERPKVGVGVIVIQGNRVLMGKRKNSHGNGTWSFPGGHLEFNESLEGCAVREVKEETGIQIKNIHFAALTNDVFETEKKHYITVYMRADYSSGTPKVIEPEKSEEWGWFEWGNLPTPLFIPIQNLLKQKFDPFQ